MEKNLSVHLIVTYQQPCFLEKLEQFRREMLPALDKEESRINKFIQVLEPLHRWLEGLIHPLSRTVTMSDVALVYPTIVNAGFAMRLGL
jgi:hypothetical protein